MNKLYTYGDKQFEEKELKKLLKEELERENSDSRFKTVLGMVEGKKILDFGCHAGIFTRLLAKKNLHVVGIDTLPSAIEIAKEFNQTKGAEFICNDLFKAEFPSNEFDSILFLETIEHLNDPTLYLTEFKRILKPGGSLIISTPNAVSYINILHNLFFLRKKAQLNFLQTLKTEPHDTGTQLDHIFSWDFVTLSRYLIRNDFLYSSHKFTGAPVFNPKKFPLSRLFKYEYGFLLPILGSFLSTLVIKVKKHG